MFIIPRPGRLRLEGPQLRRGCLHRKTLAFMRGGESASALSCVVWLLFSFRVCFFTSDVDFI